MFAKGYTVMVIEVFWGQTAVQLMPCSGISVFMLICNATERKLLTLACGFSFFFVCFIFFQVLLCVLFISPPILSESFPGSSLKYSSHENLISYVYILEGIQIHWLQGQKDSLDHQIKHRPNNATPIFSPIISV